MTKICPYFIICENCNRCEYGKPKRTCASMAYCFFRGKQVPPKGASCCAGIKEEYVKYFRQDGSLIPLAEVDTDE